MRQKLKQQSSQVRKEEEWQLHRQYLQSAIARLLTGIHFPKNKSNLRNYAKKNIPKVNSTDPNKILDILNSLPDIEYRDMADVEKSIGNLI